MNNSFWAQLQAEDIHAALGNSQLKQLDHFIDRRRGLVSIYNSQLEDLPVGLPDEEN